MDKFEKAFKKLSPKELRQLDALLAQLKAGSFQSLDIKKLKGESNIYRARKGNLRVVYEVRNGRIFIIHIGLRNEQTYKNL